MLRYDMLRYDRLVVKFATIPMLRYDISYVVPHCISSIHPRELHVYNETDCI